MKLRHIIPATIILTVSTIITGSAVRAQSGQQTINVTVRPAQTAEERVADEIKAKELRKAAEEKLAAEESARIAALSPKALLSSARTIYIESNTSFFEPVQMQNALRKREEFKRWQMAIVDGWDKRNIADTIVEIDRPLFTYTFTYKIAHRRTGVILATGKITAFDGNAAAPKLAERIIDEIRNSRAEKSENR